MIPWRPIGILLGGLLAFLIMVVLTGMLTNDLAGTWRDVRQPMLIILAMFGCAAVAVGTMSVMRLRARSTRDITRYEIVLAQADEAPRSDIDETSDTLVKTMRTSLVARLFTGQPWFAFELWHAPPIESGETGETTIMLLCEATAVGPVLAVLRRISPNLSVREEHGQPRRFDDLQFYPDHVLRVAKTRPYPYPITDPVGATEGNPSSVMATVIRAQQEVGKRGFASCVRFCVLPADSTMDSRAAGELRRIANQAGGPNAAVSADIVQSQRAGGGSVSFVEVQAAVQDLVALKPRKRTRRARWRARVRVVLRPLAWLAEVQAARLRRRVRRAPGSRQWTFADLQSLCATLVAPASTNVGANTLSERMMYVRQHLYCERWKRATPPVLPDPDGSSAMWPSELARLIELPNLASEFDLPVVRSTTPNLPVPRGLPRATMIDLPEIPPEEDEVEDAGFRVSRAVPVDDVVEVITDAEIL